MKYAALCLTTIAAVLLALTLYGLAVNAPPGRLPPAAMPELRALPPQALADQRQVATALQTLAGIARRRDLPASNGGVVATTGPLPLPPVATAGVVRREMPQRNITVRLHSAEGQTAVIDGRLVREGTLLDDGGRVLQLRPGGAVVQERSGRQTLALPLDQVRIGTLRWPQAEVPAVDGARP